MRKINIDKIIKDFQSRQLFTEDDVKLYTYSDIISPIQKNYAPNTSFQSEHTYLSGGRVDGTISNLVIEYKRKGHFKTQRGKEDALFGRKQEKKDSGLYQYIINSIDGDKINDSILKTFGLGFDGEQWLVSRFSKSETQNELDLTRTRFENIYGKQKLNLNYAFKYKVFPFKEGIDQIITLISSTDKITLSKENLSHVFNPKSKIVSTGVMELYSILKKQLSITIPQRTTTLYNEWDRTFGTMFGDENQETEFNETSQSIKKLYGISDNLSVESKPFLFATQTYFNIVLKMLIDSFIKKITDPSEQIDFHLSWSEIAELFEGRETQNSKIIANFFEIHYYEWFTYLSSKEDKDTVSNIIKDISDAVNKFDLATYIIRPEEVQDVLQEIYMTLIPDKIRHLLGEYFSPDWIVEHSLNRIEFHGDIDKKIIDPTCGSGAFVIQSLKRVLAQKDNQIDFSEAKKITNNIVGFDLNPISAISAKANYILTLLSSTKESIEKLTEPLNIPIYISDSVLSPIVYSEESKDTFVAKTTVADFVIPKFNSFSEASKFLGEVSKSIELMRGYSVFEKLVLKKFNLNSHQQSVVKDMYEEMASLHRSSQDSFWGRILKNSFAPVMLKQKFDYVVGNPPWIAWKAMSKTYREGTLDVWKSYGIFEKNAYDKKTTHDDFGMAVTYVALDQYLKKDGKLYFLLPWTFIKSTKGGEGFRKFELTRNGQKVPVKVELLDDFNDIKIFKPKHTVRTIGILLHKGKKTTYPMSEWFEWNYKHNKKINFDAHATWDTVKKHIEYTQLVAKPIDSSNLKSAWLTLPASEFGISDKVLLNGDKPEYQGRKGIEPAGAKGVYILKKPVVTPEGLEIVNDMTRQRRIDLKSRGEHPGVVEDSFIYPMLGGRNIRRWRIVSNEFMLVPHKYNTPYGLSEETLAEEAPKTYEWLEFYKKGLLASRIQSGKFFNPDKQPWYRLDNVGDYTFSKYKVVWKEQAKNFSAVAIGEYSTLPGSDLSIFKGKNKPVVVDSKVLMLATDSMDEAYYVSGVLNAPFIRDIIDAYAVGLNRGVDVLRNIKLPKFDSTNPIHLEIAKLSEKIHQLAQAGNDFTIEEGDLDVVVHKIYS